MTGDAPLLKALATWVRAYRRAKVHDAKTERTLKLVFDLERVLFSLPYVVGKPRKGTK